MFLQERLQAAIHVLEVGFGVRIVRWLTILLVLAALGVFYDTRAYHGFSAPEAMDAAQVARNLSEGRGFTTECIRPFSIYLVQKHNRETRPTEFVSTNVTDAAQVYTAHPDLANAPLYPVALAGLMKVWTPQWKVEKRKPFWSEGGSFRRYQPEFCITIFNQLLLFAVVVLTFLVARKLFDLTTAGIAAGLTLGLDVLWKFSVSGLSTLLLMVIFLALVWCLVMVEEGGRSEQPNVRRLFIWALLAGLLTGLGMLTRYSFGWLIVPVIIFLWNFGGARRTGLGVVATLTFALTVLPWIIRNEAVSGTLFGTAGYAAAEGTFAFPGARLMQSLNPDLTSAYWIVPYERKLMDNLGFILHGDIFQLGEGWLAVLFFAGLLLSLRNTGARRLRYFVLMSLGVLIFVEALGRTQLTVTTPEFNSENLLVLTTPFIVIFGTAFFLAMLNQIDVPALEARLGMIVVLAALIWQPLLFTIISRVPTMAYPPYYPPDVQRIASWMEPEELMMSDIPWAVAWYGDRQCAWTTINSQYEFFLLNDHIKPVSGLYLSLDTVDAKFFSECLQGGVDNWKRFTWQILSPQQRNPLDELGKITLTTPRATDFPTGFPLKFSPQETIISGLFITDRQRW